MYSVSNMIVREPDGLIVVPMELFWFAPTGFQLLTVPHCWPPKYSVSLRGRSVTAVSALATPATLSSIVSASSRLRSFRIFIAIPSTSLFC